MAVHLVSLQWLSGAPAKTTPSAAVETKQLASDPDHSTSRPDEAPPRSPADVAPDEPQTDRSEDDAQAQELASGLGLSPADVAALVGRDGADVGKALLSLITRISALESELGTLRHRLAVAADPSAPSSPAARPAPPTPQVPEGRVATGRSALLDQVFKNNLELWKSIEEEEKTPRRKTKRGRRSREA